MSHIVYQQKLASMAGLNIGKMRALGEALLSFIKTPIVWASAAVLAFGAITTAFTDAWQAKVKTAQDALNVNEENIQQYQSELDSL